MFLDIIGKLFYIPIIYSFNSAKNWFLKVDLISQAVALPVYTVASSLGAAYQTFDTKYGQGDQQIKVKKQTNKPQMKFFACLKKKKRSFMSDPTVALLSNQMWPKNTKLKKLFGVKFMTMYSRNIFFPEWYSGLTLKEDHTWNSND